MNQELIFATSNANKVAEIQALLPNNYLIKSLKDINYTAPLSEPFFTLEENAKTKAVQLQAALRKDCFAEDSGLFINALQGEPGVHSARYSGEDATDKKNIIKVLQKIENQIDKSAYFKTVIHLIKNDMHYNFIGICNGTITTTPIGENGFGYDPIFIPTDIPNRTFAQLSKAEKNTISHRAKATEKFVEFLRLNL